MMRKIIKHLWNKRKQSHPALQRNDIKPLHNPWWGNFQIETGQSRFWRIGDVVICLDRFTYEWHIASSLINANLNKSLSENRKISADELQFKTFTFTTSQEINLNPVLPDRSLSSVLTTSLYIPAYEQVLLYISSPIWVQITTNRGRTILEETSTHRLTLDWFGSSLIDGELCYSGKIQCSCYLKDLTLGLDRIISPILIKNLSNDILKLKRIRLPLPHLSVYSDENSHLWTEQLTVYYDKDDALKIQAAKGLPRTALVNKLSQSRLPLYGRKGIKRVVHGLIGI